MLDGDWSLGGLEHSPLVCGLIGDRQEPFHWPAWGFRTESQVDRPKWRAHSHPAEVLVKPSTQCPGTADAHCYVLRASSCCPQWLFLGFNCDSAVVPSFMVK